MKKVICSIIVLAIITGGGYFLHSNAYTQGYDDGYDVGYEDGYSEGEVEGYDDANWDLGENDLSGYIPNKSTHLTTDTAPSGTVWTTPAGEKYHEGWCRYISGRNDLIYYLSANDAINAGFSPCSVCH